MFTKVLIANRGEIALRVIQTAQAQGFRTVAVYSDADACAPHVLAADEAVCIGAAPVGESYLCADKILAAAALTQAEAIHPGYGFLSENAGFSQTCQDAGLTFIGPDPKAITLMGCKRQSKIAMLAANVPCVPGYEDACQDDDVLQKAAIDIGFPVMIKASAGGGGRGMRLVHDEENLLESIRSARSEALNAFGSGELIIEKAVQNPRHIEIQIFADRQGNTLYLGERDCSIQRRHQKVVEESPSPFVNEALRKKMGQAAVLAAKACDYVGAGTVEFLVDANEDFYFLEMNTRLQVEHPVTELITGLDLVALQLSVASGDSLPLTQDEVKLTGHAIEVRLYAEDPANTFLPQTGKLHLWRPASGEGVRIDSGISEGQVISPYYDPMLAKLITFGDNREQARRRLVRCVEDTQLLGLRDNRAFLSQVLKHPSFVQGQATTAFIGVDFVEDATLCAQIITTEELTLSALLLKQSSAQSGWRNNTIGSRTLRLNINETTHNLSVYEADGVIALDDSGDSDITPLNISESSVTYLFNGIRKTRHYVLANDSLFLSSPNGNLLIEDTTYKATSAKGGAGSNKIQASMDGAIVDVLVNVNDSVTQGQTLVILEAMKMEHPLKAGVSGVIESISVVPGDQVKTRQLLVKIKQDEDGA
jgi:geranyl-CoA carboxylase alpha subunit